VHHRAPPPNERSQKSTPDVLFVIITAKDDLTVKIIMVILLIFNFPNVLLYAIFSSIFGKSELRIFIVDACGKTADVYY
jgi:hypothetical protein